MKRIGLFGGSFDPIHDGHLSIINQAISFLDLDHLLVIPCFHSPGKQIDLQATNAQRINMIELALKDVTKASICLYELEREQESFSIDTVRHLLQESDANYFLIIGSDQLNQLDQWKEIDLLSQLVQFVCVLRDGIEANWQNAYRYKVQLLSLEIPGYSSTRIRNGFINGLNADVLKYQTMHAVYLNTMIRGWMSEYRAKHSIEVAHTAKLIASYHNLSTSKALVAGYLHDIAKEFPMHHMDDILSYMGLSPNMMPYQKHQHVGRFIAEFVFLVDDADILSAIESHARITSHMSMFDQMLYVADKNEPTRSYETNSVLLLSYQSIWNAFKETVVRVIASLEKKGFDEQELTELLKQNEDSH